MRGVRWRSLLSMRSSAARATPYPRLRWRRASKISALSWWSGRRAGLGRGCTGGRCRHRRNDRLKKKEDLTRGPEGPLFIRRFIRSLNIVLFPAGWFRFFIDSEKVFAYTTILV